MTESGLNRLDLIKIDVEGHEEQVFSTLTPLIDAYRPKAIVFEHAGALDSPSRPIRRILDPLGYHVFGIQKRLMHWRLQPICGLSSEAKQHHDYVATTNPPANVT